MKAIRTIIGAALLMAALALSGCSWPLVGSGADDEEGAAFDLDQTISDGAQRTTLAFSALAMMTGNLASQSFYPPGKVADYTGFQYLRDNDPDGMGHNTSFLTRVAEDVIAILDREQLEKLGALASRQQADFELYAWKRFPLMQAFRRLMDGDVPAGSAGLSLAAVKAASRELYLIDGRISYDRAVVYSEILAGLEAEQKAALDAMVGVGWKSWPDNESASIAVDVKEKMRTLVQGGASPVAVMTYAGDIFSWYAGTVEADTYFCPERQGTYFGSFYMKDAPAIGHEGYGIDTELTATAGKALCEASEGYVDTAQAATMSALVDTQRANLYGGARNIISVRREIATLLRQLRTAVDADGSLLTEVLDLSGTYGELDGENNYAYASTFAAVYHSLSAEQKAKLLELRTKIMSGTYTDGTRYDFTVCATPYLYSAPLTGATEVSTLAGYTDDAATDGFFE